MHAIALQLASRALSSMQREQYLSAEPLTHLEDGGTISRLLRLDALRYLCLDGITFTFDECKALGDILSSGIY